MLLDPSETLFSSPVMEEELQISAEGPPLVDGSLSSTVLLLCPPPASLEELLFCALHRLEPPERKLPNVMEPLALMKGVVRCCWLG